MVENLDVNDYVLYVEDLSIEYTVSGTTVKALTDINFGVKEHESVGIVGESGCGKSTLAMAISHILPGNSIVKSGRVYFRGEVIVDTEKGASFSLRPDRKSTKMEAQLSAVRWSGISIVFQGALDSLNPLFTIGQQMDDVFIYKSKNTPEESRKKSKELINSLGLDDWVLDAFPHQLSGGMKQRVVIAMAMTLHPVLIIADEPTTSLDVITQYRIIEELQKLREDYSMSIVNISHDISLVSHLSDRIMVMYAGKIVEKIPEHTFRNVQHPYTRMLINSIPSLAGKVKRLKSIRGSPPSLVESIIGCPFYERCDYSNETCANPGADNATDVAPNHSVSCGVLPFTGKSKITIDEAIDANNQDEEEKEGEIQEEIIRFEAVTREFEKKTGLRAKNFGKKKGEQKIVAVDKATFSIKEGQSLALVGETGSGKTTISRMLGMLDTPTSGSVHLMGDEIPYGDLKAIRGYRKLIQTIFQDPFQSINPRHSIYKIVSEPLRVHKVYEKEEEINEAVNKALETVELTPPDDFKKKFPHQLSGGQRQRVSMARSLILNPKIIIADEPISMLDVSLRAGILNLLKDMQRNFSVTLFYITHDIASARYVSDHIIVLYKGQIVERGDTETVITRPSHPYTIALILSSLGIEGKLETVLGKNIFTESLELSSACKFSNRCPLAKDICRTEEPGLLDLEDGHLSKCHFAGELLKENVGGNEITDEVEARKVFSKALENVESALGSQ